MNAKKHDVNTRSANTTYRDDRWFLFSICCLFCLKGMSGDEVAVSSFRRLLRTPYYLHLHTQRFGWRGDLHTSLNIYFEKQLDDQFIDLSPLLYIGLSY